MFSLSFIFIFWRRWIEIEIDLFFRYEGLHHGSSYLEHLNFLSAIRAKGAKVPAVDLQDGLISVAIGVAAQLSIEKGRFIAIEEVMEELNCIASAWGLNKMNKCHWWWFLFLVVVLLPLFLKFKKLKTAYPSLLANFLKKNKKQRPVKCLFTIFWIYCPHKSSIHFFCFPSGLTDKA